MRNKSVRKWNTIKERMTNSRGMTMGEMLVVVAIIAVLSGVGFISVINYQRTLAQTERDGIAKEIFIAAQNHLTMAKGEEYLGVKKFGLAGTAADKDDTKNKVFYYVVNGGTTIPGPGSEGDATDIFAQTLPLGAVDETVRGGGSYIIRYQPDSGLVLDVFYCSAEGSRFGHNLKTDEYTDLMSTANDKYYGDGNKSNRREYGNDKKAVVGWYGGATVAELEEVTMDAPEIEVTNAETLYVTIMDKVDQQQDVSIKDGDSVKKGTLGSSYGIRLLITGKSSGKEHYIDVLDSDETPGTDVETVTDGKYKVVLDDITKTVDDHFVNRNFWALRTDDNGIITATPNVNDFIPGEDITVQAVAYTNLYLANVARSEQKVTNSLFAGVKDVNNNGTIDTAYISNIRHLENLDRTVSKLDKNDTATKTSADGKLVIGQAVQTANLNWTNFLEKVREQRNDPEAKIQISYEGNPRGNIEGLDNCFKPIDFDHMGIYDGKGHSISNIRVNAVKENGHAGLFSFTSGNTILKNVELVDFGVTAANGGDAGALVGSFSGSSIVNVVAHNSDPAIDKVITGNNAGGLIGSLKRGTAKYSAASVIVKGNTSAGGLVGDASAGEDGSSSSITQCYSGGHTKNGSYKEWIDDKNIYDVTGSVAGGLVGIAGEATLEKSYSTCSVDGNQYAGGLVGTATVTSETKTVGQGDNATTVTTSSISDCYCTGQVKTKTRTSDNTKKVIDDEEVEVNPNSGRGSFAGAFGEDSVSPSNCAVLEIINEVTKGDDEDTPGTFERYLYPVGDDSGKTQGITAIDGDTTSYDDFVGAQSTWNPAEPYDNQLTTYYNATESNTKKTKFNLRTVDQLPASDGKTLTPQPKVLNETGANTENYHRFVITHYGDWPAPEVFIINE